MTTALPVVLDGMPVDCPHPRVTVVRRPGTVNAGDGLEPTFAVRYVVDGRPDLHLDTATATGAARRAATLVRARRPRAVWLFDERTAQATLDAATEPWRPLARAASDVQAAFVSLVGDEA